MTTQQKKMPILCGYGVHKKVWSYSDERRRDCVPQKSCIRCGQYLGDGRIRHQKRKSTSSDSCWQITTCIRCERELERVPEQGLLKERGSLRQKMLLKAARQLVAQNELRSIEVLVNMAVCANAVRAIDHQIMFRAFWRLYKFWTLIQSTDLYLNLYNQDLRYPWRSRYSRYSKAHQHFAREMLVLFSSNPNISLRMTTCLEEIINRGAPLDAQLEAIRLLGLYGTKEAIEFLESALGGVSSGQGHHCWSGVTTIDVPDGIGYEGYWNASAVEFPRFGGELGDQLRYFRCSGCGRAYEIKPRREEVIQLVGDSIAKIRQRLERVSNFGG